MKPIFLVIALIFLVSCSSALVIEKTYLEKLEEENRIYLKGVIDRNVTLNERQKFLEFEFAKCSRDLIKNPHTINNLMKWQKDFIYNGVSNFCLTRLQKEYGDITELLEVLN